MTAPPLDPRQRFLREIADRISAERIAEIHLFPSLRAGGRESGVAVIAATADQERDEQSGSEDDVERHDVVVDAPPSPKRLVVYRAVYRWTRKGPDRGRWEVDITAEADAPLDAVSDVVRGVQRRAGDEGEPELITPQQLRLALSDRPWAAAM